MKNREIYTSALSILAQSSESGDNHDYEERAPYIIANFLCDVAELDELARKLLDLPPREEYNQVWQPLDSDFPFIDRFASAASKYLAAMLVLPDDENLFEKLGGEKIPAVTPVTLVGGDEPLTRAVIKVKKIKALVKKQH